MRSLKLILDAGLVVYGIAAVSAHWRGGDKPAAPAMGAAAPRAPATFAGPPLPAAVQQVGRIDKRPLPPPPREALLR